MGLGFAAVAIFRICCRRHFCSVFLRFFRMKLRRKRKPMLPALLASNFFCGLGFFVFDFLLQWRNKRFRMESLNRLLNLLSSPSLLLLEAPKANDAVSFYKAAFGAEEVARTLHPKRKAEQEVPIVLSAEVKIGGFSVFVSDLVNDSFDAPKNGANNVAVCLETSDVAAAFISNPGFIPCILYEVGVAGL